MKKQKRNVNKLDKYFLLSGKKFFIIMIAWFACVILHNLFYALSEISGINFGFFEALFFLIGIPVIPIYLIIAGIYSLFFIIKYKKYPQRIFYIKLLISIVVGFLVTLILIYIDFLNDMYLIPLLAFSFLVFGIISLFQKNKKN